MEFAMEFALLTTWHVSEEEREYTVGGVARGGGYFLFFYFARAVVGNTTLERCKRENYYERKGRGANFYFWRVLVGESVAT